VTAAQRVIGIDPALTHTGIAVIERAGNSCLAQTFVIRTDPPAQATIETEYQRITTVAARSAAVMPKKAALAIIEAPALDAEWGNAWDRAAVWWWIAGILIQREIPVARVSPLTLKKWATGHAGTAKRPVPKSRVVQAMHGMWPGVPATSSELRHHECEALAMAHMCAQRLGWPVPARRHHGEALAVIKWPPAARVVHT